MVLSNVVVSRCIKSETPSQSKNTADCTLKRTSFPRRQIILPIRRWTSGVVESIRRSAARFGQDPLSILPLCIAPSSSLHESTQEPHG